TTDMKGLRDLLGNKEVRLYCGLDATADSLHIGHLVPVTLWKRFQQAGRKPMALDGGDTGMIGEPSGRSTERTLNDRSIVKQYSEKIKQQITSFLNANDDENPVTVRNNHDWLAQMTVIDFLRDAGKHFGINYMLAKESVSARIEEGI